MPNLTANSQQASFDGRVRKELRAKCTRFLQGTCVPCSIQSALFQRKVNLFLESVFWAVHKSFPMFDTGIWRSTCTFPMSSVSLFGDYIFPFGKSETNAAGHWKHFAPDAVAGDFWSWTASDLQKVGDNSSRFVVFREDSVSSFAILSQLNPDCKRHDRACCAVFIFLFAAMIRRWGAHL